MKEIKVLTALNDATIPLPLPSFWNGGGAVQYGAGGQGTIVVEATVDIASGAYHILQLTDPTDGTTSAALTAAGVRIFNIVGYEGVRVRKSVAGTGPVTVYLRLHQG